jgi:hypothetical protein
VGRSRRRPQPAYETAPDHPNGDQPDQPDGHKEHENELTKEQLLYLAGVFDVTRFSEASNDLKVGISKTQDWPRFMAEQYGGEAVEFTSHRGKLFWGWDLPLQRRLELIWMLDRAGLIRSLDPFKVDGLRGRLTNAINRLEMSEWES